MKHIQLFSILFLVSAAAFAQDTPDGEEIIRKSREVSKISGLEAVSTLKIYDPRGRERIRKTRMASKMYDGGVTEKRIIRFESPADVRGTGMLIFDHEEKSDDMWIFMPALRKTRRIVSREKSKSFMGSEFSNADMSAPNLNDFTYQVLGSETAGGVDCWKLEILPANEDIADEFGFSRKISWIGKNDFVNRQSVYYDLYDELWKTLIVGKVEMVDRAGKKYLATEMEMNNEQTGRRSVFVMEQLQYNPDVKDEYFTIAYLERM